MNVMEAMLYGALGASALAAAITLGIAIKLHLEARRIKRRYRL